MQRSIRILILVGAPLMALGLWFVVLSTAFICYDMCPPESDLAATLAQNIANAAPIAMICALPVASAWLLSLAQLARVRRWGALAALTLALPLAAALSLFVWYVSTDGQLLPTTWLADGGWDTVFAESLALMLLWPVAIFVATVAPRGR